MDIKNVVIVNDFNYIQGGASKVAIDTARIIKDNGIRVYFFSAVNRQEENISGIQYISTNQNEALKEKNKINGVLNGIYNLKAKKKFKKLLETLDNKTTIIHVHGWTKALSCSVFDIAFKMKFKVVLTLHDYFTACPNGGYFNYKANEICHLKPLSWKCIKCNCDSRNYGFKIYRILRQFVQNKIVRLNEKIEYVISISNFSEKILIPTLNKNITVRKIYNPIEINEKIEMTNLKNNEYYLYVGRVSKEKGVDMFCQAITELGYKGVVVGDGDERKKLNKQYPNIKFVGWKDKEEVKKYMKHARALVFPSKWYEGAPLTPLEAMSIGLPCVVSDKCAAKEFIQDKKNGFVFETLEDLKEKIVYLNEDNKLDKIGRYAYESYWKEPFNEERYIENIIKFYSEI